MRNLNPLQRHSRTSETVTQGKRSLNAFAPVIAFLFLLASPALVEAKERIAFPGDQTSELHAARDLPTTLSLIRVAPNPTTRGITLSGTLAGRERASIRIFDVAGRLVRYLEVPPRGIDQIQSGWDGRDENGALVRGGIYFVSVVTRNEIVTNKVTVIR